MDTDQIRSGWLAAIIDSADDAIISKTLDGIITSWNRSAQRIFGYTANEIIGRPVLMLIPPDRHDEEERILSKIRRGERVEQHGGEPLVPGEPYTGMPGPERGHRVRDERRVRRGEGTDPQPSAGRLPQRGQLPFHLPQSLHQGLGVRDERAARLREPHPARQSVEQRQEVAIDDARRARCQRQRDHDEIGGR